MCSKTEKNKLSELDLSKRSQSSEESGKEEGVKPELMGSQMHVHSRLDLFHPVNRACWSDFLNMLKASLNYVITIIRQKLVEKTQFIFNNHNLLKSPSPSKLKFVDPKKLKNYFAECLRISH